MSEIIKWLTSSPIATGLLFIAFAVIIIAFVLILFIILRAYLRGDEIQAIGIKIGRQWRMQAGSLNIPANHPDKSLFFNRSFKGIRTILVRVEFKPVFKERPNVIVSLNKIDLGDGQIPINRLKVSAQDVHEDYFQLCFETWEDSIVYDAAASWIAIGVM